MIRNNLNILKSTQLELGDWVLRSDTLCRIISISSRVVGFLCWTFRWIVDLILRACEERKPKKLSTAELLTEMALGTERKQNIVVRPPRIFFIQKIRCRCKLN